MTLGSFITESYSKEDETNLFYFLKKFDKVKAI